MGLILEPFKGLKTRYKCPQCGYNHKFTRYINDETKEYIADYVGRCDRENNCGYHLKPREYFQTKPIPTYNIQYTPNKIDHERPVNFLPDELLSQTMIKYKRNNFFLFLESTFGTDEANRICSRYNVGTSKHWDGSNIFWQKDIDGKLRQCKIMLYDPVTGRRVKSETLARKWNPFTNNYENDEGGSDKIYFAGKNLLKSKIKEPNLRQCFFGEHLLQEKGHIAIVESEKSACISSFFFPNFIWIATGGKNGARFTEPEVCKVFKDRKIVMFPDEGEFENWYGKATRIKNIIPCRIIVSDLLEKNSKESDSTKGWDLADYLLLNYFKNPESNEKKEVTEMLTWQPIKGA